VSGINLKVYTDQIFVLLGHNGAGKTTLISMLTGLLSSTEGSAKVFGINIIEQLNEVRKFMGVCPQHDILFENLTTEEHLSIFYDLKGADPSPKIKQASLKKLM
jgi:ATP-binding cassette, subfamily A (ABC1), member 3